MNIRTKSTQGQTGAALVVLLMLLLLASAAILLDRLNGRLNASANTREGNATALAEAKAALIAWAATYPPSAARESMPGTLPYPDRNGDGDYDGMADCDPLGVNDLVLVGRLPRSGEDVASCGVSNPLNIDLRDGIGEPLWYAVSRNVLAGVGVAGGPINPDMGGAGRMAYPWIKIKDDQGNDVLDPNTGLPLAVAAVIFAPGAAVAGQDRTGVANPSSYLDSITIGATTYDNADADGCPDNLVAPCGSLGEEFIVYSNPQPGDDFNDQLIYITVNELMRAVEKRVLGDTALALDAYRSAAWNPGNVYPWMAAFRSPRAVATGIADSGSAVHLDQAAGNFVAKGVQVGDILVNIDDGSQGPITAVTPTRIDFEALAGGTENDVDAGENFVVEPSFKSTLDRDGQLPVHLRNEVFNTAFTASWDFTADPDPTVNPAEPPVLPLTPPLADMLSGAGYNFTNGRCLWSEPLRVDCTGSLVIGSYFRADLGINVARTVEVSFSFPGDSMVVTPPQPADVRRRDVTITASPLPAPVLLAAPLLPQVPWTIQITDSDGVSSVARTITMDLNTNGSITVNGIRFDLSVVYDNVDDAKDELPEWFAENNWHHYIYAAISQDAVAGGNADLDGDCATPVNTCLSLNVAGAASRTDIRGLLVSSGMEWTNQNRDIGDCDGDGGGPLADPMDDSFLCAYLDGDTSLYDVSIDVLHHGANTQTITADFFSRDVLSAGYNDQIRVIEPLPP